VLRAANTRAGCGQSSHLRHVSDPLRGGAVILGAVEQDTARIGQRMASEDPQQRCLARARRAEYAKDAAFERRLGV